MLEDRLLIWKLKRGNGDALRRIYENYKNDLLALAITLSNDATLAEDAVHDVFVSFAEFVEKLQLRTNLKSYLSASVANRLRNLSRAKNQRSVQLNEASVMNSASLNPDESAVSTEESQRISRAMAQLPYEQREVIVLRLLSGMKFKAIAESQGISINTAQSRYRYGLDKLRSILNSEVQK